MQEAAAEVEKQYGKIPEPWDPDFDEKKAAELIKMRYQLKYEKYSQKVSELDPKILVNLEKYREEDGLKYELLELKYECKEEAAAEVEKQLGYKKPKLDLSNRKEYFEYNGMVEKLAEEKFSQKLHKLKPQNIESWNKYCRRYNRKHGWQSLKEINVEESVNGYDAVKDVDKRN